MTDVEKLRFRSLSTITVTFNSASFIIAALESIQESAARANLDLEMIVIDNASSDQTVDLVRRRFPDARLESNHENLGFARANNRAFDMAHGDFWLLVNPDAILHPNCVKVLSDFLASHARVAAVAPSIEGRLGMGPESAGMSPGLRSLAGHFLFLNRFLPNARGGAWQGWQLASRPQVGDRRVDWLGGTVAALRPEAIRTVGGFDNSFFLYFEDVDLGERLRQAGWELWLTPVATATHQISHGRISTRWLDALHWYYGRRVGRVGLVLAISIVAAGLVMRAIWRMAASRGTLEQAEARRARANALHAVRLLASSVGGDRPHEA